jgi:probable HAF family extracellular repeat protein
MTRAFAQAINNEGTVVGEANATFVPGVAVVWDDGVASALTPLAEGATAAAADVNDLGQIVGNSATTAPPWLVRDPVLWDAGTIVDLGSLGGSFGLATAVNASGQIAGYLANAAGETRAFLWDSGIRTFLDPLPGDTQSFALGMNGSGEIVGISQSADGVGRAVRWTQARDTTPPELTVSVSPSELWPPNHKYVIVKTTLAATDDTDSSPAIELVSVTSNEPDNAPGDADGNTTNDIVTIDDHTFDLRAERDETGSGRIYTITYRALDASGNSTTRSVTVTVPART